MSTAAERAKAAATVGRLTDAGMSYGDACDAARRERAARDAKA